MVINVVTGATTYAGITEQQYTGAHQVKCYQRRECQECGNSVSAMVKVAGIGGMAVAPGVVLPRVVTTPTAHHISVTW